MELELVRSGPCPGEEEELQVEDAALVRIVVGDPVEELVVDLDGPLIARRNVLLRLGLRRRLRCVGPAEAHQKSREPENESNDQDERATGASRCRME